MRTPHHATVGAVVMVLIGVAVAVIVYALTTDVVWTAVPLLLAIAAARQFYRRRAHST